MSLGFTSFWWYFCLCDCFVLGFLWLFYPTIEVVSFHLHGWCMVSVLVAGIHRSGTWTSGSFESVWWIACVHRQDIVLYSHPKELGGGGGDGNGVRTHVDSKGNFPLPKAQRRIEPRRCIMQNSKPHTTNWAILAPICLHCVTQRTRWYIHLTCAPDTDWECFTGKLPRCNSYVYQV